MRTHRWIWALAAALLAACGTYGAPDSVVYGTDVLTLPQPGYVPSSATTNYYLDPTMTVVKGDPNIPGNVTTVRIDSGQYASVGTAVDSNMVAAGFTNKISVQPPQGTANTVAMHLSALTGTAATYYPGYWCDYWYYYSCYYTWYYAGSYNYGSVIVEMVDASAPPTPPPASVPILWQSQIYGVATTASYDIPRIVEGINRAFSQSPYLAH